MKALYTNSETVEYYIIYRNTSHTSREQAHTPRRAL